MRQRQSSATTTPEKAASTPRDLLQGHSRNTPSFHLHHSESPYPSHQQPQQMYAERPESDAALMVRLMSVDDADAAAGEPPKHARHHHLGPHDKPQQHLLLPSLHGTGPQNGSRHHHSHSKSSFTASHLMIPPPVSMSTQVAGATSSDLEFFDDLVSEPVLVLGFDISHLSRRWQFAVCASGVFGFSLLYGYLQELISVQLCDRRLGLFLATVQFVGYTALAYLLRRFVYERHEKRLHQRQMQALYNSHNPYSGSSLDVQSGNSVSSVSSTAAAKVPVPMVLYLGLSLLRALDLGMTNLAMQYLNYPAKTLLKSSRVVFTMLFGVLLLKKQYQLKDYLIVGAMVLGLALFLHADAHSSAVFSGMGVFMLTVSLVCDGAITNVSETIMRQFGVGQDEFIFKMYSIALVAISVAAAVKGDLKEGLLWLQQPGTVAEMSLPLSERTWSVSSKIGVLVLFSSMGFFGSSCSAAITKNFGALTMSVTSVTRKATTLFLSFFLFNNVCTVEHVAGVFIFIAALTAKSLRRRNDKNRRSLKPKSSRDPSPFPSHDSNNSLQRLLRMNRINATNGAGGAVDATRPQIEFRDMTGVRDEKSHESLPSPAVAKTAGMTFHNTPYIV